MTNKNSPALEALDQKAMETVDDIIAGQMSEDQDDFDEPDEERFIVALPKPITDLGWAYDLVMITPRSELTPAELEGTAWRAMRMSDNSYYQESPDANGEFCEAMFRFWRPNQFLEIKHLANPHRLEIAHEALPDAKSVRIVVSTAHTKQEDPAVTHEVVFARDEQGGHFVANLSDLEVGLTVIGCLCLGCAVLHTDD